MQGELKRPHHQTWCTALFNVLPGRCSITHAAVPQQTQRSSSASQHYSAIASQHSCPLASLVKCLVSLAARMLLCHLDGQALMGTQAAQHWKRSPHGVLQAQVCRPGRGPYLPCCQGAAQPPHSSRSPGWVGRCRPGGECSCCRWWTRWSSICRQQQCRADATGLQREAVLQL